MATHWRSEGDTWSDLLRYATRSNAPAANAVFASITVTTTADTIDAAANCPSVTLASLPGPDGQISLREAICAANSNAGPDTITFSVNGTFALTGAANEDNGGTGDFDIKQSLTINGNGTANTILDGSGIERIFDVFPSAASTFDLSNLTIQNGDTRSTSFQEGGAMYLHNNVTATLNSIQVINNFSGANGAIETGGSLTINNSVISNNQTLPASGNVVGGGIRNAGTLTIDNTTISNNTVRGEGGGIATTTGTAVTVTITDSTISGNTASVTGGGNGNGGGISTTGNQGTINITNSTISGNRADANGGGAAFASVSGGAVTLTNVTITNNTADNDNNGSGAGGGFSQGNTTTVTLRNTIVAGNFNSTAATRDDISGAVVNTSSYNLIGDGTGMSGTTNGVNNNQVGSGASPINPLLGALSNNGGSTQTHALLSGSPAIDTGSTALAPATDQRGVTRPGGAAADIGAYEVGDTVPPDTTITGNPTNPSNSSSATFTFTGSDNVTPAGSLTFQCQIDSGGFSACTSPRTYTGLADGSHTFQVRAVDAAGNTDPTPASYTWTVDATPPNTTITANPTNPSASANASFSFTGSDPGGSGVASFQCQMDGGGFSSCTSPQTYVGLADGSHTFQVRAIDAAGNVDPTPASFTWTIDATGPDTTITANPTNPSASTNASFSFTGNDGSGTGVASFQCQLDGGGFSTCTSPQNYTGLADGSHTFQVRAVDTAGNADSTPASYTWVIDTIVPDTTITANPTNPSASANASFSFTGNDGSGSGVASFQCQLDGSGFSACASPQTYTGLSDGSHTFQVRAIDAAGNTDSTPASFTWSIDTAPPDTTITANPPNPSSSTSANFSFTGNDGSGSGVAGFQCQLDGGGFSACTSPQNYTGLSQGSHTFQVRAIDTLGNIDPTPASYTWSTNSPPTIMAVATSRTEGSPVSNSQIATVNDVEDAEDQLGVTVNGGASAMSGGITINNIVVSSTGIVTANVEAVCGAVTTDFTLRVTDTVSGFNETILKITVDPNTPPTLTYPAEVAASLGQTLTVNPATGPADNGPNLVLAVESISAGFTGTASVASNGRVTINNAGPLGTHTFTIKATDNCGAMTQTSFMVTVFPFIAQLSDPLICTDNGTTLAVHAEVTNPNAVAANLNFSATIPAPMSGVANTCVSSAGTCTLTANNVTVTGLIAPNQTVTIDYKVAVANGTPQGTQLCIDSTASFNGGPVAMVQACTQLNCPAGGVVQANAQKTGSVLVFPYYNSQSATQSDTRMTISNVGNVTANVHVFFIAGASCEAANLFICLTPRASFSFKASEYDPETTGWLLAVAVDDQGRPIRNNVLVGNGFVREGSYLGNYGAESFAARSGAVAAFPNNNTATLFFDGSSYDAVPDQFAVELQSPQEVPGQRLVTVGLRGDLTASQMSGAGQVGTGLLVNGNESPMSSFVSFLNGNCQAQAILTGTTPRVAGGVNTLIPPGQVGTMRWQIGAGVGLLMTPRGANGWSGIRNLHKTRATTSAITIPVFPPVC
ncbi:MAG: hypothetical protein JNM09_07780 [Blastocatellia bacterium]|nr:hypothetical protein [Blastocatellia bacterium]